MANEASPTATMANRSASPPGDAAEFETEFDVDEDPPSLAIMRTIAAVKDIEPDEMDPLYGSIDPDALDTLFRSTDTEIGVRFRFDGHEVMIESEGRIRII